MFNKAFNAYLPLYSSISYDTTNDVFFQTLRVLNAILRLYKFTLDTFTLVPSKGNCVEAKL